MNKATNHTTSPVSDAMIEAGIAQVPADVVEEQWGCLTSEVVKRIYLAMKAAEQPSDDYCGIVQMSEEDTRADHSLDEVERVARIIDPSSWEVMDSYLQRMLHKYRGQDVLYDTDKFKHKESMAKAREILSAIRNGDER